jgi:PHP family Zn ribbon phosphoesterase
MKFQTAKWNRNRVSLQGLMGVLMAIILSGCSLPFFSGYGAKGQTREEFTRYVEEVFKLQNRMSSKMMALAEEDEKPAHYNNLLQTEQKMQKMCEALNEYAQIDSDGGSPSLLLQSRVEQTAVDCDKAAKELKALFKNNDK